jgi:MFS transporter, DHA2 family, methylenomycin A resistance protein
MLGERRPAAPGMESGIRSPGIVLALLCLSLFVVYLDATVTPIALPAMRAALHMGIAGQQWVVDAYTLAFACLLLSAGSVADIVGRRRIYLAGIGGFTLLSAACALARSWPVLVAARAVQGGFAAAVVPVSLAIASGLYPDARSRGRAVGIWAGVGGVAYAAGPALGGFLVGRFGWPSIFWLNLPVGVCCSVLLYVLLPGAAGSGGHRSVDVAGQVTLAGGIACLVFGLIEGNALGWASVPVLSAFTVGAGLLLFFVAWEGRQASPVLPPRLLRIPAVAVTCTVNFLGLFGLFATLFLLTLYLQDDRHLSPGATGLQLLTLTLSLAVFAVAGPALSARIGTRPAMLIGSALTAAGLAGLVLVGRSAGYGTYWWALAVLGAGIPLSGGAVAVAALLSAAPSELAGTASATMNTFRQVGAAFGVALAGALLPERGPMIVGMRITFLVAAAGAIAGGAVVLLVPDRSKSV